MNTDIIQTSFKKWRDDQCNTFEEYIDRYIAMEKEQLERLLYLAWRDGYIKGCDG